jgi:hypothetical protein
MTVVTRHSLTNKDAATLTADCSICGFVAIRKAGNGFQCAIKKAQSHRAWVKRNPEKATANRRLRSTHELFGRDYAALTAKCAICGPVDMVMWGAGYACGVNARALRSTQQTAQVGGRCRECEIIDGPAGAPRLRADGSCPRCVEGPDRYVSSHVPPERRHRSVGLAAEYEGAGFTVVHDDNDPYSLADTETAVPGWRTLGSHTRAWNEV